MDLELVGVVTDPGSGLTPRSARRAGVELLDPEAELVPQYRDLLRRYDRLISLHASSRICPMYRRVREAGPDPARVRLVDTGLGSAGLGAAAKRAAELLRQGAGEGEAVLEIERLRKEGRFLLATYDLSRLVENRLLPPMGDRFGQALGLWALLTLERGAFRVPPLPVPRARVIPTLAGMLGRRLGGRRARVRLVVGDLPEALKEEAKRALAGILDLERATLAPMDPLARGQVGDHAMAVFAYPV